MNAKAATEQDRLRSKDLARIHLAKKELGLDDDSYRDLLVSLTGKSSSAELDARQRWTVLKELGRLGAKSGGEQKHYPGRPARQKPSKESLISKIEAHLADAQRPWAYANGMAKRMFKVDQVQWCDEDQLRRIVAALEYDKKRRER